MKISWKHLYQFVDLENISIEEAANRLTLAGFEVESMNWAHKIQDTILDVNITANRQDITGCAQIATELSAILNRELKISNKPNNIQTVGFCNTENIDLFAELYAYNIGNINILHEDINLASYLNALNSYKVNSIIDIVELINLKWGQSIHIYSFKTGAIKTLDSLRFSNTDKQYNTGDNKLKVRIDNQELLCITQANIKEHRNNSSIILINYRHKERKEGADYSAKRSISYSLHAYSEIASILKQKTQDKNEGQLVYCYVANNKSKKYVEVKTCNINKLLGPIKTKSDQKLLDSKTMLGIINRLNLGIRHTNKAIQVLIPDNRNNDIDIEADIAEEVARIYGFNHFYDSLPYFKHTNPLVRIGRLKQKARSILRSMGLHEIINYSLQSRKPQNQDLRLINALNQEQEVLRKNLISGILSTQMYNGNQANDKLEAFEIGNVFTENLRSEQYQESLHLSCLLDNKMFNQTNWQTPKSSLTWLQAKGHAEELLERINAKISWSTEVNNNSFTKSLRDHIHPTKSIYMVSNNQAIGVLSQADTSRKESRANAYFIEINLDELAKTVRPINPLDYIYSQYSNYPKITRDFSIKIGSKVSMETFSKAIKSIKNQKSDIVESVEILNEYYNSQYDKTICLRAIYRSKYKTLTNEEVEILDNIFKVKLGKYAGARHKPGSVLNDSN